MLDLGFELCRERIDGPVRVEVKPLKVGRAPVQQHEVKSERLGTSSASLAVATFWMISRRLFGSGLRLLGIKCRIDVRIGDTVDQAAVWTGFRVEHGAQDEIGFGRTRRPADIHQMSVWLLAFALIDPLQPRPPSP